MLGRYTYITASIWLTGVPRITKHDSQLKNASSVSRQEIVLHRAVGSGCGKDKGGKGRRAGLIP